MDSFHIGYFQVLLLTLVFSDVNSRCYGIKCKKDSVTRELFRIRYRSQSSGYFWFGRTWSRLCGNNYRDAIECFNPVEKPTSLSSRLFGKSSSRRMNNLNRRLIVRYTSPPGSYIGCNDVVTVNTSKRFLARPNLQNEATPWDVRMQPQITWQVRPKERTLFTLVVVDVGLGNIHGLWVDIPGNELHSGKVVIPYNGLFNFRRTPTPYAFLLFKQKKKHAIDASMIQNLPRPILKKFADKNKLIGPVAMNWIMVSFDEFAAQKEIDIGFVNNCPYFLEKAIQKSKFELFRSFLPDKFQPTAFLNVTFSDPTIEFDICCKKYIYKREHICLNPIGDGLVESAYVRTGFMPKVDIIPRSFYPQKTQEISNKIHTVLFLAADLTKKSAGTYERPLLHWVLTNIQHGDGDTGIELKRYIGPLPPDGRHYYHFLVYEHTGLTRIVTERDIDKFAAESCHPLFAGRCLFDIKRFVNENGLILVSASWFTVQTDPYVRYRFGKVLGFGEEAVCKNQPDYFRSCVSS